MKIDLQHRINKEDSKDVDYNNHSYSNRVGRYNKLYYDK